MPRAKPLPEGAPTEPIWYLRSLPYGEYRQSRWWRTRRDRYVADLVARWGLKHCELCRLEHVNVEDIEVRFNVHHMTYEHLGYERDEDLILLCSPCHNLVHYPDSEAARHWIAYHQADVENWDLVERAEELHPNHDVPV